MWAIGGVDPWTYHFEKTSLGTLTDPVAGFGGLMFPVSQDGIDTKYSFKETEPVAKMLKSVWQNLATDESGQDIAEYAVMLAVILVIVVGTIRLIGSNANNVFSNVGSSIQ